MSYLNRITKELSDLQTNPIIDCTAGPDCEEDITRWTAVIIGPDNTPYEKGIFKLKIQFSKQYPFKPPKVQFITKIFHPNIGSTGAICLDILKQQWSPALTIGKVLLSISSLLAEPNPTDPLVPEIADLYLKDHNRFVETAKLWTATYATKTSL